MGLHKSIVRQGATRAVVNSCAGQLLNSRAQHRGALCKGVPVCTHHDWLHQRQCTQYECRFVCRRTLNTVTLHLLHFRSVPDLLAVHGGTVSGDCYRLGQDVTQTASAAFAARRRAVWVFVVSAAWTCSRSHGAGLSALAGRTQEARLSVVPSTNQHMQPGNVHILACLATCKALHHCTHCMVVRVNFISWQVVKACEGCSHSPAPHHVLAHQRVGALDVTDCHIVSNSQASQGV